jgi:hypothetical protein
VGGGPWEPKNRESGSWSAGPKVTTEILTLTSQGQNDASGGGGPWERWNRGSVAWSADPKATTEILTLTRQGQNLGVEDAMTAWEVVGDGTKERIRQTNPH